MVETRLEMIRGTTFSFDATISNSATGLVENLTNAQAIKFTAKWDTTDSDANAVFQKTVGNGVTILTASLGTINVVVSAADTANLPYTTVNLNYDLKYTDSTGNPWEVMKGLLNIQPNITQN